MAGKGSAPRKGANQKAYESNWEKIFGKNKSSQLGIGDFCNRCGKPHNGTGFYTDKIGRVCDLCGVELRGEENG